MHRRRRTRIYRYKKRLHEFIELMLYYNRIGEQIKCFFCSKLLTIEDFPLRTVDKITIHHRDGNHENNDPSNLAFAHRYCHKKHHMKKLHEEEKL